MPRVYRFQMPDGRVARIAAASPEEAQAHAVSLTQAAGASQDAPRSRADQTTYLQELQKQRATDAKGEKRMEAVRAVPVIGGAIDRLNSFGAGVASPLAGEAKGLVLGAGNEAANLYRRAKGKPLKSSRAIFDASRDATDEEGGRDISANPVSAGTGSVLSLLYGAGELAKGAGVLKGLAPVKAATKAVKGAVKTVPGATRTAKAVAGVRELAKDTLNPKLLEYGGKVAKGVGAGGATGALLGAAEGHDAESRGENALFGGEFGAATGGLFEGVAAPLLRPFAGAAADVARGAGRLLRKPLEEGAVIPEEVEAAKQAFGKIMQTGGVTAKTLADKIAKHAGLGQVAAEAGGSTGQNILASLARRAGQTGDNLRTAIRARSIGQPEGIVADFKRMLNLDPETIGGDIAHQVKAGREAAGPEFDAYYEATRGGVQDPEVDRLLATPMGQRLARGIERRAKNIGREHEALTYGRVEVPRGEDLNPVDTAPVGPHKAGRPEIREGSDTPPAQGHTFLDWLARQGGAKDTGGDMAAMNAEKIGARSRLSPQEIDDLALEAQRVGFLPHNGGARPTVDDFLELVRHQTAARGAGKPELRMRPRANKSVTWEHGRPVRTGKVGVKNEEPAAFAEDFTEALKRGLHGGKLEKALDTSSDYLRISEAVKAFKGKLINGTVRDFDNAWLRLKKGADQQAARGALAMDVIDLWGRGLLKGGKFGVPGVEKKLTTAFGKPGAKAFVAQMERRAELAASGSRMAPFSGSPTMSLQEAAGATNEMAPLASNIARIGGKLVGGHPLKALGDAAATAVHYSKTAGMSTGFRNELGRLLSLPSDDPELLQVLHEIENLSPEARADFLEKIGLGTSRAQRAGVAGGVATMETKHD